MGFDKIEIYLKEFSFVFGRIDEGGLLDKIKIKLNSVPFQLWNNIEAENNC